MFTTIIRSKSNGVQRLFATLLTLFMLLPTSIALAADHHHPAQQLVEGAVNTVMADLQKHQGKIASNPEVLDETLSKNIIPHLDFTTMTRLSVGKSWRKATPEQQTSLVNEFTDFLLNTYRSALSEYGGESVVFKPFKKPKREGRAVVASTFKFGSAEVPVNYKLHDRNGPWQVYDIIVSDLSLVIQYKSTFGSEIDRNGIEGLIKLLRDKNNI